jgi:N-acetyltransferase
MRDTPTIDHESSLVGGTITLRPLRAGDFEALYAAASDPLIWEQHPEPERHRREFFKDGFFTGAVVSGSAYVVIDNASGRIIGSSRYYDWDPEKREVAIGYTFLARSHWGGATNGEMKRLMLEHAARWADVVWFHIARSNGRSRRAIEKIGGQLSHEGRKEIGGAVHDYVFYRIDLRRPYGAGGGQAIRNGQGGHL